MYKRDTLIKQVQEGTNSVYDCMQKLQKTKRKAKLYILWSINHEKKKAPISDSRNCVSAVLIVELQHDSLLNMCLKIFHGTT